MVAIELWLLLTSMAAVLLAGISLGLCIAALMIIKEANRHAD